LISLLFKSRISTN